MTDESRSLEGVKVLDVSRLRRAPLLQVHLQPGRPGHLRPLQEGRALQLEAGLLKELVQSPKM